MADAVDKRTIEEIAAEEMDLAREETDELETTMREITIRFSEAFDNMPPVPRPLPPEYKFISVKALLDEAKLAAPFKELGIATDTTEELPTRKLRRLEKFYNKAVEYRVIHKMSGGWNRAVLNNINLVSLGLSTIVTILLLLFNKSSFVAMIAGILSALVAGLTSWTKYARYEFLAENHMLAGRKFAALSRDIALFFVKMSEFPVPYERSQAENEALIETQDVPLMALEAMALVGNGANTAQASGTGAGGHFGAEGEGGVSDIDPQNLILQTLYRKSVEYRLAHGTFARDNAFKNDALSFSVLVASTGAGLLLFMGDEFATICAVIAACITALNALNKMNDYSGKAEAHAMSKIDFGGLQRDLLTLLTATPYATQKEKLDEINNRFNEATNGMPVLHQPSLLGVKGEDGDDMYNLIIDSALLMEAGSDLMGHVSEVRYNRLLAVHATDHAEEASNEQHNPGGPGGKGDNAGGMLAGAGGMIGGVFGGNGAAKNGSSRSAGSNMTAQGIPVQENEPAAPQMSAMSPFFGSCLQARDCGAGTMADPSVSSGEVNVAENNQQQKSAMQDLLASK